MITILISLSLPFSLLQLVLRRSSWFSSRMHFLCVFSSPLVYHCFTVKLFNSFIGVSTLVTFLFERHGCVRGVVYMSNVSCNISLLFYRSFELIPVSCGRQISFLFVLQRVPPPFTSPPSLGFYRRRPGGIVKARRAEKRYAVSK